MAGSSYLLDTVIVIANFDLDVGVVERLSIETTYVSSITVGELFHGAYNSRRLTQNLARLTAYIASSKVLVCDTGTADHFGRIKAALQAKGRPIPENDIWIAATALQYGLTLATRDAHFHEVAGLPFEMW